MIAISEGMRAAFRVKNLLTAYEEVDEHDWNLTQFPGFSYPSWCNTQSMAAG